MTNSRIQPNYKIASAYADGKTHYRVCNYCEAMCGVQVTHQPEESASDAIFRVRPDKSDTFSKGSMCPKASALGPLLLDQNKLKYPVKKENGDWKQITWEEAYETVSTKLVETRNRHGENAIGTYLGNPIVHNLGMMLFVKKLTKAIGSRNVFSATSMDQLPHHFAAHFMFGHEFRIPVPDIDRTDHMVLLGANPMASNGSIMTSAGVSKRLRQITKSGGKLVVIDPRATETARIATNHHFIVPSTDVYFLLAFLHVLFQDKHVNLRHLSAYSKGLDQVPQLVTEFSPEAVAPVTNIAAATIRQIVSEFAKADRAVVYGRMGVSTQLHGGLNHWLINLINIVSGNFDVPGGMMFPSPAIELARETQKPAFGRWKSRVRGLQEFAGELPVSSMTEEIETHGEGQIRTFVTVCGNPVLSSPGGGRLDKALESIDFMVSIDNYINETTRHADIILPTPSGLEIDHYDFIFNTISVTNNVKFSSAMVSVEPDRPFDWQILKELTLRVSRNRPKFLSRMVDRYLTPRRIVNIGLLFGPYGKLSNPLRLLSGLSLRKVLRAEHGINLGPLVSRVPGGLKTADRKIHLVPEVFLSRLQQVSQSFIQETTSLEPTSSNQFKLIGRRNVYTNNSWMHQVPKLNKSKQVRCTAMINDQDAAALLLKSGNRIRVQSRLGKIDIPVEVTPTMMPGVICIPHGFGHNKAGTQVPIAESKPGVSVNDITDHLRVDPLTGNAAFSGLDLTVEKIADSEVSQLQRGKKLTVLYGSQSGNAELIALDIVKAAEDDQLLTSVRNMSEATPEDLKQTERLLVIVSTFGEGDMPDDAVDFWEEIHTLHDLDLQHLNFSVLGLGDPTYENFCQSGILWDQRLEQLGGLRILPLVKCDTDYLDSVESWRQEALPLISEVGDQSLHERDAVITEPSESAKFNRRNMMTLTLGEKRCLSKPGSSKVTMHYELAFDKAGVRYEAGDVLHIMPNNSPKLVQRWMQYLSAADTPHLYNMRFRNKLTTDLEIRLPATKTLQLVANHCDALTKLNSEELAKRVWGMELIDVLEAFSFPVRSLHAELVETLPVLNTRAYSIASSPGLLPDGVALTVANVRYGTNHEKCGVGTDYLANQISPGEQVSGFLVTNKYFGVPADSHVPVIMIGPGTGVAPFRGFLYQRQYLGHTGDNWLFFGDRNRQYDFLYEAEWLAFQESGLLTRLDLAFSRDQPDKIYVQDLMKQHASDLYEWLQRDAYVFVCGDAKSMAASVENALLDIIRDQGKRTDKEAEAYLAALKTNRRYVRDVY